MSLGAFRLKKVVLVVSLLVLVSAGLVSCGLYNSKSYYKPPSGLVNRVLASQGITSSFAFGGLIIVNGYNDTLTRTAEISAGSNPGLMAESPTRNIVAAFDASSNSVFSVDTVTEQGIGRVQLPGPTFSMVVPSAAQIGYAAIPTATVPGFSFIGAVDVMNLLGAVTTVIGVTNAQTVVSNSTGTQLLVFSNDSDSVTVLFPQAAVPPVDTSCNAPNNPTPNAVCVILPGFDRPVNAVINGNNAYILNCGPQCGGVQASVMVLDLTSLTVTNTIPVDAATIAFLPATGPSVLYVAGTPPTNNACTGQTTAATICGRLDIIDLGSMAVTSSQVITDGFHNRMDMSVNGQLFVGSYNCTNIGDVNNPSGEVRGCLSILNTTTSTVLIPPDNGDVTGLQSFTSRNIEYVAQGGVLRVYDTTKNILLINNFLPQGTINIVGKVTDIKAIDFF
jgi:hypothetical protein